MKKILLLHLLSFLLITVLFPLSISAAEPVILNTVENRYDFGKHLEYIADSAKAFSINEVTSGSLKWLPSERDSINFGFTSSVYWFRFSVHNTSRKNISWYFEISYPLLDYIELYIPSKDGRFTVKKSGDHYPFYDREIVDRNFVYDLTDKPGIRTYYLRIETTSSLNFIPIVWSHNAYFNRANTELPITWIYYGLLLVMVVYNMFLFFSIRERAYIYYSLFIVSWILFQLTLTGFAFQYLWPEQIWWGNNCLPFLMCLTQALNVLFIRNYIDTEKNFPVIDKFLIYGLFLPLVIWSAGSFSGNYMLSITIATGLTVYFIISIYIITIFSAYRGSRPARFLVTAYIFLIIGLMLYTMKTFGVLPSNFFTRWSIQMGISFLVVSLSLGLADKINTMKLHLANLNLELQDLNLNLEQKVRDRTEELSSAMNEMEAMNDNLVQVNSELETAGKIHEMDMKMAASVQTAFFPGTAPSSDKYDIAFVFNPLSSVSGDFYDFYETGGVLQGIGLFDVSGHGISSGLITLIARSIVYRNFSNGKNQKLNRVMDQVNQELIQEIGQVDNYITGILLRLHEGKIEYVNGGHPDLLYKSAKSKKIYQVTGKNGESIRGYMLGIRDMEQSFKSLTVQFKPGDSFFIYSDSLSESKNREGTEYDTGGLMTAYENAPDGSAAEILDFIINDFYRFVKDKDNVIDDLTAILIRCKG